MAFKMTNPPYPKHGHAPYNLTKAQSDTFDTNKDGEITGSDFPLKKKKGVDGKECWAGYDIPKDGPQTKQKGGKTVDNCKKM